MPSLASFADFVLSTGSKLVSSPNRIINDATKQTYFIGQMVKGRDVSLTVQAGKTIIDRVQLSDSGTATFYDPMEDLDIQNVDVMRAVEVRWRFLVDHYCFDETEMELNGGDPQTYFKNLLKGKRQACETSLWNKKESALWAPPAVGTMETAGTGGVPYSIPCLVTPDGLAPSGFTTVMGLNPTTESGWRNQVESYDPDNVLDLNDGLLRAMDRMFLKVQFEAPQGGPQEYFENDRLMKMKIATNMDGRTLLASITRDTNDRLIPANNLGWVAGNIVYAGLPVQYVRELDTALINSGAVIASGEPWFYYLNLNYLFPVFHARMYMKEHEPKDHPRQPFTKVVWKNSYYNLFCQSRRRQGIIVPS